MAISTIVQSAEGLTALLVLLLVFQVGRLYRTSAPSRKPPAPACLPTGAPEPAQSTTAIMESYIDELLGDAEPVGAAPKQLANNREAAAPRPRQLSPHPRPADRQPYQPLSLFLTRRYDTSST